MLALLTSLLLAVDPSAEERLARASVQACQVALAKAPGAPESCEGVKRGQHGWVGLAPSGGELLALRSRTDDGGEPFRGLCAHQATWSDVAMRGARVKARKVPWVALQGDSDCRLPPRALSLAGTSWQFVVRPDAVAELKAGATTLRFPLRSECWTEAAVGDFDGDGLPDLLLARVGAGFTWALHLTGNRSADGAVRLCATTSGPPC